MGLDGVELIMAFEEEFDLIVPNSDASVMLTVGAMEDYAVKKLSERAPVNEADVRLRVRKVIVASLHVKPRQLTRETRFIEDLNVG